MGANAVLFAAMEVVPTPLAMLRAVRDEAGTIVDFEFEYINSAGANEILVPAEELVGHGLLAKLPAFRETLFGLYQTVVETGEPLKLEEQDLADKWGTDEVVPRVYDIRALRSDDGLIVFWSDVTDRVAERKVLEQHLEQGELFDMIIRNSPIGMAQVSANGTFASVNPAFSRITGFEAEALVGRTFAEITHPDDLNADLELVGRLANREIDSYVMDKRYIKPTGEVVWVRLNASALWRDDGSFVTFIAQVSDIDFEKRLIQQLERSNHDLVHFAHVASHDLQAPLRLATTYSELLFEDLGRENLTAEQLDYVDEVNAALRHMRMLVADLLEFSRATSAPMPTDEVNVSDVISTAISQTRPILGDAQTSVTVEGQQGLHVLGSETQLARMLVNLLTNAAKYRSANRESQVVIRTQRVLGNVEISVIDNGRGVPPASQERVFAMFQRLRSEEEGTGLGLALVRSIVERHGGSARIESDGHSGTAVIVCLPLSAPA